MACAARAEFKQASLSVLATNASQTFTDSVAINGWIDTITIDVVSAASSGTVGVVSSPYVATIADVTLIDTAAHASDTVYRPRFDGTDTAGAALTGDDPWKYLSYGNVILSVTASSATGLVYRAVILYEQ